MITALLGSTIVFYIKEGESFEDPTPKFLFALIIVTYILVLFYNFLYRRFGTLPLFAHIQIGTDLIIWSGLVYVTGGVESGFTFFYSISVIYAAILLGQRAAYLVACEASCIFILLGILLKNNLLPLLPDQMWFKEPPTTKVIAFHLSINLTAFFIIAALSGLLARRLKYEQRRYRNLKVLSKDIIHSLNSGLITTDIKGGLISLNPKAYEILDLTKKDINPRNLSELLPKASKIIEEAKDNLSCIKDEEVIYNPLSKKEIPIGFSITPLMNGQNRRFGYIVNFQDLTSFKEMQEKMRRSEYLAALGKISSGIAHEIRNPLGSISGALELLKEVKELKEQDRTLLDIVIRETQRLNQLITEMLEFSRSRGPQKVLTSLATLLQETVKIFSPSVKSQGIEIKLEIEKELLAEVDPFQMKQVFWNLLKNAAQAMSKGGEIIVKGWKDTKQAIIEIQDQGPGIQEQEKKRIFEPFYTTKYKGLGMGLALVHQIITNHGAKIEVLSGKNKGTTFRISISG
jgi:two-component system sensor histidine kinase PilS (NtrC family)